MRTITNKVAVVLLRSMRKLGALNTVVQVKKGFAKNFLIPNKFACLATEANLSMIEAEKSKLEHSDTKLLKDAEDLKSKMDGIKIIFYCKTRDAQNIYGSIAGQNIATKLVQSGYDINKSQILLGNNLKTLGVHDVRISLYGNIETGIQVVIKSIADEHTDRKVQNEKK